MGHRPLSTSSPTMYHLPYLDSLLLRCHDHRPPLSDPQRQLPGVHEVSPDKQEDHLGASDYASDVFATVDPDLRPAITLLLSHWLHLRGIALPISLWHQPKAGQIMAPCCVCVLALLCLVSNPPSPAVHRLQEKAAVRRSRKAQPEAEVHRPF